MERPSEAAAQCNVARVESAPRCAPQDAPDRRPLHDHDVALVVRLLRRRRRQRVAADRGSSGRRVGLCTGGLTSQIARVGYGSRNLRGSEMQR